MKLVSDSKTLECVLFPPNDVLNLVIKHRRLNDDEYALLKVKLCYTYLTVYEAVS
jgi:hypothetical protein